MNLKNISLLLTLITLSTSANAGTWTKRFEYQFEADKFEDRERSIDLFGTWRVPEEYTFQEGRLGFGAGINYFFHRNWGVGADAIFERLKIPRMSGSVILRFPIETGGTAPYLFGGLGGDFDQTEDIQWSAHIGGGLEYRFNRKTGVFVDVRRTFPDKKADYYLFRGGFRFGF